jgi:hypothetical protein
MQPPATIAIQAFTLQPITAWNVSHRVCASGFVRRS